VDYKPLNEIKRTVPLDEAGRKLQRLIRAGVFDWVSFK
jgi:hypothetical protein